MKMEMEKILKRNLLRYAVGQSIFCLECSDVLDAARAVLITAPDRVVVRCVRCHGQGAHSWDDGKWSVLDGRTLFPQPSRRRLRGGKKGI